MSTSCCSLAASYAMAAGALVTVRLGTGITRRRADDHSPASIGQTPQAWEAV